MIKLSRESDKQFRKTSKRWKREEREAEKRVLKQDVEHRRLHKEGYTLLCDGGPAPVDLSHLLIQKIIAKNCVQQNDVVLCSTTYDKDGKFIPDEVSLWAKIPKVVVRKSEKTFEFERMGYGMSRARWTVWYEGHADIKGCGLTKKEAVLDLEDRHEQVWLAKRYPLTRNTKWSFGSLKKTFEFERMGYGMSRARWTVWYEGHADIKGCGLTKKEAVLDLEDRHEQVWLAKRYPLTRNTS